MAYIQIDRDIVNHWIYKDAEYFKVWFEMLIRARYATEPKTDMERGQVYTINRGEFMFGRPSWSERLGISEQRLKTLMKKLVQNDMITLTSTYRHFSIYAINNYENYNKINQQSNQQSNQQNHLEPQGFENDVNHQLNQLTNLLSTIYQPAANQLSTTKEERSNKDVIKEEESKPKTLVDKSTVYDDEFELFWSEYPTARRRDKTKSYESWKKSIKNIDKVKLTECVKKYAKDKKAIGHDGRFAKMPTTFLNGKTYNDYLGGGEDEQLSQSTTGKYSEFIIE